MEETPPESKGPIPRAHRTTPGGITGMACGSAMALPFRRALGSRWPSAKMRLLTRAGSGFEGVTVMGFDLVSTMWGAHQSDIMGAHKSDIMCISDAYTYTYIYMCVTI